MVAIDTNILVRLVTCDDDAQASTTTQKYRNMKRRPIHAQSQRDWNHLFSPCVVAAPCNTYSIAAGLRLAGRKNSSVSFVPLFLSRDTRRAATLFEHDEIYVCKTVLLETEWVLRFSYELDRSVILNALQSIVGLPQVLVEDSPAVAEALNLFATGMDFADALHLASSGEAAQFATFDERLKKRADTAAPGRHVVLA